MQKLRGDSNLREHDPHFKRRLRMAVPPVPAVHKVAGGAWPAVGQGSSAEDARQGTVQPGQLVAEETAWKDGAHILRAGLIYRTANIGIFTWGVKGSPEGKGRVGIYAGNWYGTSIWGWARCTCSAGQPRENPCAHKAAAFLLARNLGFLPPGFPKFDR